MERYIPAKHAYRQLSSIVTTNNFIANNWQEDTHISGSMSGANGFDAINTGNPSMYTFDNDVYNYVALDNIDDTNLKTGKGYHILVGDDRTTDLTNNNATASETTLSTIGPLVSENTGSSTVNFPKKSFVFVGNPFQAPINMNNVLTTNSTNINNTFYWAWDLKFRNHSGLHHNICS